MNIRKYVLIVLGSIITAMLLFTLGYQYLGSVDSTKNMEKIEKNYRLAKTNENEIQIYQSDTWKTLDVRGIELSAFMPLDSIKDSNTSKEIILDWLEDIKKMNVNVIKIPHIQSPAFYAALDEFNEDIDDYIYTIHEIKLDEKSVLRHHDIFNEKLVKNLKKDIKKTINVVHGREIIFNNKRGNSGLYLNDISRFNLGYILGSNTNPEIVALTDKKYKDISAYDGTYYNLSKGSAFETFITQTLDYATKYEINKHNQVSLMSYQTSVETDPLDYKHESNYTSNAKINLERITSKSFNNIFIAYKYHPNDTDFLDFEYEDLNDSEKASSYLLHLNRLNSYYQKPLLISDTGISSSRGVSNLDLSDDYHRGGFTEIEQGENIVEILESVDQSEGAGAIITSWQDIWTRKSPLNMIEDHHDEASASYWHNVEASDESFGFIKFNLKDDKEIVINGDFSDWGKVEQLIDSDVKLKIQSNNDYLYLYLESAKEPISFNELLIGIDITTKSGSKYYVKEDAQFVDQVDFVIDLSDLENAEMLVNKRYNHFDYLYKYYQYVVDREVLIPDLDSGEFNEINSLNRKQFYFKGSQEISPAIYYNSGKLISGSLDPLAYDYNTLADFKASENAIEVRIPWTLLNVINPIRLKAYDDFYVTGLESNINIKDIGFSIYDKKELKTMAAIERYKPRVIRSPQYEYQLKDSYEIVSKYWNQKDRMGD